MQEIAKQELNGSKSRYEKGLELYRAGKVSINPNGLFKVSGYYDVDTERMTCTCPDYKTRKEPCKHLFAAMLFVKNRGKDKIDPINGKGDWLTEMVNSTEYDKPKPESTDNSDKPTEAPKHFDRQAAITRLAVLNTATEALKSYCKPITAQEIIEYAAQLEKMGVR